MNPFNNTSSNIKFKFQTDHSEIQRKAEAQRIRAKYPDRIPVICEIDERCKKDISIDKNKYLVPNDLTVSQFLFVIRKRIKLSPEKAIYMFTENNELPPTACYISQLYKNHANNDGFLYLTVSNESTFGYKN